MKPHYERIAGLYKTTKQLSLLELSKKYFLWKFSGVVWPVTNTYRHYRSKVKYDAPTSPFIVLHVDPSTVEYFTPHVTNKKGLGRVLDGDWDADRQSLDEYWISKGLYQRYVDGREWEDTEYISAARERMDGSGMHLWGYRTVEEFQAQRCPYVDRLYESIAESGYVSNAEKAFEYPETDLRMNGYYHDLDPLVCLDRDGKFIVREGIHRLVLCQILDVDEIPVMILVRHKRWQALREAASNSESYDQLPKAAKRNATHPDLRLCLRHLDGDRTNGTNVGDVVNRT
ncbi:hypothetical protein CV102_10265 [Natronococcus pandeyae]|uniref:ParB/Sulfiredoxin domain-containing protein n=1 Tax=Natronococcus pandeyae TaxID=2055836 RepID=A0A8J8Q467_9EURY|nr:hypothetical protein [Natronococcus pandeyae]TYL38882.1 hypothetical protein CV102_10265 [Natronococcus pandeyae]